MIRKLRDELPEPHPNPLPFSTAMGDKQGAREPAFLRSTPMRPLNPAASSAEGEGDLVAARPEALLPGQILQPGELIILLLKPSPWFILLEPLGYYIKVGVLAAVAAAFTSNGYDRFFGTRDILLLTILLICGRVFWQFLDWLGRTYVLTDRRVIRIRGVMRIHVFECQLKQVQHTTANFSLRERLFGLGTIGWNTSGTTETEAYWRMIANPLDVHQTIIRTLNRYR